MKRAFLTFAIFAVLLSTGLASAEGPGRPKYFVYLPIFHNDFHEVYLGMGVWRFEADVAPYILPGTIVHVPIKWHEIETSPGVYDWSIAHAKLDNLNFPLALHVKNAPAWARIDPALECSPIKPDYYDDYAAFILSLFYEINHQYVYLWNEPDLSHNDHEAAKYYGCNWTAEEYAAMLRVVYPILKSRSPGVAHTVVAGELAMVDATMDWWSGVLALAGGNYDGVSFHAYAVCGQDNFNQVLSRRDHLRAMGETAELYWSETALLCPEDTPEFRAEQEAYFDYAMQVSGLHERAWLTLAFNNWQNADLIGGSPTIPQIRSAYDRYKFWSGK